MKKFYLMLFSLFVWNSASAETCYPEGITFQFQQQINSFAINNPNCTEIGGDLVISGYNIYNLNGLKGLTAIGGSLKIVSSEVLNDLSGLSNLQSIGNDLYLEGNFELENLAGLENITHIGRDVLILNNIAMTSLTGLEGVYSIPGMLSIENNGILLNLNGLNNLNSVGGTIRIFSNGQLANLNGLNSLISIGGSLFIGGADHLGGLGNPSLLNILALSSLTEMGGQLEIGFNSSLTSLEGIGNINSASIIGLRIYNNDLLSTCDVQSICLYLANPGGSIEIFSNATGCNSQAEVEEACVAEGIHNLPVSGSFAVYGDPTSGKIIVETTPDLAGYHYSVLNINGQAVINGIGSGGRIVIDLVGLPAGIYFLRLTGDRSTSTVKLIRL